LFLLGIELSRAVKPHAPLFGSLSARTGPFANQSRSNSAIPANTVMIIFPACDVVSAHGSEIDWNFVPVSRIVSMVSSRSRVKARQSIKLPNDDNIAFPDP
jgi:hypothetical protein